MPEISRFYGIVIKIYFADHSPPHLHAEYGSEEALLNIETLAVIAGNLPLRAMSMAESGLRYTGMSCGSLGTTQRNFNPLGRSLLFLNVPPKRREGAATAGLGDEYDN